MATGEGNREADGAGISINDALRDDELLAVLARLRSQEDRDLFGLVCKRWVRLQSYERRSLRARAGPAMLRRMADRFPGVLELDLSQSASRSFYPGVTDADLAVVASGFSNLLVLGLQNCKGISDVGLITLGHQLPSIQSLDVSSCRKLTDKGLTAIAQGCFNLRRLLLSNCKSVTDGLLQALSKYCIHLEELGLSGCNNITDSGLLLLVDGCRHIQKLDLSKCTKVGDRGITKVSEVCTSSLRSLKLLDCFNVGERSIYGLAAHCRNIETLVIGGCRNVSDESIKAFASSYRESLIHLRMDWCTEVSDSSLGLILTNCSNLVALDIRCCDRVTDLAFQPLERADFESKMKFLRASNCTRITVSAIRSVFKSCKYLEHLDVRSCPNVSKVGCDAAGIQFLKCCKVNFSGSLAEADSLLDAFF